MGIAEFATHEPMNPFHSIPPFNLTTLFWAFHLNTLEGEADDEGTEGLHAVAEGIVNEELHDERVEHHVLSQRISWFLASFELTNESRSAV